MRREPGWLPKFTSLDAILQTAWDGTPRTRMATLNDVAVGKAGTIGGGI